jgi:hypothetical protein
MLTSKYIYIFIILLFYLFIKIYLEMAASLMVSNTVVVIAKVNSFILIIFMERNSNISNFSLSFYRQRHYFLFSR